MNRSQRMNEGVYVEPQPYCGEPGLSMPAIDWNEPEVTPADRREALRVDVHGIWAWLSGPVHTPAVVVNVSLGGLRLSPLVPLPRSSETLTIELFEGTTLLAVAYVRIVHTSGDSVGCRVLVDRPHVQGRRRQPR